jgi:hypothetical protein
MPAPSKGATSGDDMLKIIGAVVLYGFALFGLAKYLENTHSDA